MHCFKQSAPPESLFMRSIATSHREALLKRRIRFVVLYPAINRQLKGDRNDLIEDLSEKIRPETIEGLNTQDEYDCWFEGVVEEAKWSQYRGDCPEENHRWGQLAKLINIVIYEILHTRGLIEDSIWQKVLSWLHLPLDSIVVDELFRFDQTFKECPPLNAMTKQKYCDMQDRARKVAVGLQRVPISFEDSWSLDPRQSRPGPATQERQRQQARLRRKKNREAKEFALNALMNEKKCTRQEAIQQLEELARKPK